MPSNFRIIYEHALSKSRIPIWFFSGPIILVLIPTLIVFAGLYQNHQFAQYLNAPKKGDIYEVSTREERHTLYKIKNVRGDTVYFTPSRYQTENEAGVYDLYSKDFDSLTTYAISKKELVKMYKENKLSDISR
ncbi:MAG TPA: hypothetical protein VFE53_19475 [Mucilaginibacter sp.]|jgi:hypothetical protein|nr:hypothetical protein [Mucilaginibacter sp.]